MLLTAEYGVRFVVKRALKSFSGGVVGLESEILALSLRERYFFGAKKRERERDFLA